MTKQSKREQKIRRNIRNVSLEDFEALIKHYGYIKEGGRHPQAVIREYKLPYKRENPISPYYAEKLLKIIDSL